MIGPDPSALAEVEAAFTQGYADADERQQYHWHGGGVPCGVDPPLGAAGGMPVGLGYSTAPVPRPVYVSSRPGLVPMPLDTPLAFDATAGPALTGATHGWGSVYPAAAASRGSDFVYLGLGDEPAPPRRSLWGRLTGKGR